MKTPLSSKPLWGCIFCSARRLASASTNSVMRAVQTYRFGGLDDLLVSDSCRRANIGGPDEVLVRVRAASVNPMDLAMLSGYGSKAFAPLRRCLDSRSGPEFPLTLGRDFSGEVVAVGHQVASATLPPGSLVIGAVWPFRSGSLCDFVSVPARDLAPKPVAWDHVTGAALPYAGLTAYSALVETGGLEPDRAAGKSVLVLGATGGVGSVAVQLCAAWRAHIVATAHPDAEDMVLGLGANCVVSADGGGGAGELLDQLVEVSPGGEGYDVVLDGIGLPGMAAAVKRGRLARYVTLRGDLLHMTDALGPVVGAAAAGLKLLRWNARQVAENQRLMTWGFFRPSGGNLRRMGELGERGLLRPVVDSVFPLEEARAAFEKVRAGGLRGKVVLQL